MNGPVASVIPFRQPQATEIETIVLAFAVTAVVLAAFVAAAWLGRRHGWWRRWSIAAADAAPDAATLVVEQLVPVSRDTRVFVLRRGNQRWLLSESTRATAWTGVESSTASVLVENGSPMKATSP
jgi:hypothetical protein